MQGQRKFFFFFLSWKCNKQNMVTGAQKYGSLSIGTLQLARQIYIQSLAITRLQSTSSYKSGEKKPDNLCSKEYYQWKASIPKNETMHSFTSSNIVFCSYSSYIIKWPSTRLCFFSTSLSRENLKSKFSKTFWEGT